MTPQQIAKSGSEHAEQSALFAWCAMLVSREPVLKLLFAIPNGGSRGDDVKARKIRGAILKAEGVKPGVPDVCLPVQRRGYAGLYIEMKKVKGGVYSDAQRQWKTDLTLQGYFVGWCPGWEDAKECIKWYLDQPNLDS